MFLSEWRDFPSAPCLAGKKKPWWQLASRCCWNRARPLHASELVSFLVALRTYQHSGTGLNHRRDDTDREKKQYFWEIGSYCATHIERCVTVTEPYEEGRPRLGTQATAPSATAVGHKLIFFRRSATQSTYLSTLLLHVCQLRKMTLRSGRELQNVSQNQPRVCLWCVVSWTLSTAP